MVGCVAAVTDKPLLLCYRPPVRWTGFRNTLPGLGMCVQVLGNLQPWSQVAKLPEPTALLLCWVPAVKPEVEVAWKWNKRDFYTQPVPRNLLEPPPNVKNEMVSGRVERSVGANC